jgi:RNA-directed DNA polymerase
VASEDLALNPEWRERIAKIGKQNFVREEMLRLGFLDEQLKNGVRAQIKAYLDSAYPRLAELKKDLSEIRRQIGSIDDIDALLKEVRQRRIERVKKERQERQLHKADEQSKRRAKIAEENLRTPRFLGHGVSTHLKFEGGNTTMLAARGLPAIETLKQLAELMKLDPGELLWLSYERAATTVDHYIRFEIPKRSGGRRLISSPKPKMRHAQSWILENVLSLLTPSKYATAFRPATSIVDNATPHLNAPIVVKLDLKDFFPSTTFPRVRGYFEYLGFNAGLATVLALICTDAPRVKVILDGKVNFVAMGERGLPQGACTSPALANLIASPLDVRLAGLCDALEPHWKYTRYADDLTFSSSEENADVGRLLKAVNVIVVDEGFKVNSKKTAVMRAPGRQVVTGLLVGDTIRLSRQDLRKLRAFFHRCDKEGLSAVSGAIGKDALSVARGHLAYLKMVMPYHAASLKKRYHWL